LVLNFLSLDSLLKIWYLLLKFKVTTFKFVFRVTNLFLILKLAQSFGRAPRYKGLTYVCVQAPFYNDVRWYALLHLFSFATAYKHSTSQKKKI
jgi:hypothetical protein